MLKVIIQLLPFGSEINKKIISQIVIGNTGKKNKYNEHTYTYRGWVEHEPSGDEELNNLFGKHEFRGTVEHDRRDMVYKLIYKIVHKIIQPYM